MSLMIGLLIGIMGGVLLSRFIFREKPVGSLRVDESDPDSGPYLFLELDRSGADAIYKQRYVRLRVELKNYISSNSFISYRAAEEPFFKPMLRFAVSHRVVALFIPTALSFASRQI